MTACSGEFAVMVSPASSAPSRSVKVMSHHPSTGRVAARRSGSPAYRWARWAARAVAAPSRPAGQAVRGTCCGAVPLARSATVSVVEVLDCVVGLLLGELVTVGRGQLVADRLRGHVHRVPVDDRGLAGVLVPVRLDRVDRVLRLLLG